MRKRRGRGEGAIYKLKHRDLLPLVTIDPVSARVAMFMGRRKKRFRTNF